MRYWSEGFIDSTFGTDGQTVSNLSPDGDVPTGMILLPRDMILLGASFDTYYGLSVMGTFGLARYDSAGRLDPGFGNVRFPYVENVTKFGSQLMAFAMQDTNKIILAGFTETGQQVWDFTMTRVILKPLATPGLHGDPNGDGAVNVLDMLAIANHILGLVPFNEGQMGLADCNGDGNINVLDMVGIANVILGLGECEP